MTAVPESDLPSADYVAAFAPRVDVDPSATALVVVDVQYGLASRAAGLGRLLAARGQAGAADYRYSRIEQAVVPNTMRLLEAFRAAGLRSVFLSVGSTVPDFSDLPPHLRAVCRAANMRRGEREFEILDELAPRPDEPVVHKLTLSAFASSPLERLLRSWAVTTLVFAGVTTNMCVEHNVRDAADRGFGCVLVEDACATDSPSMHRASVRTVARLYGRIASTDEVLFTLGVSVARA